MANRKQRVDSDTAFIKPPPVNTKAKRDDSVMATNGSSIVSKRSVERLYYDEPHFFRYFVKKPQRRSPLINRGYWLRMHAVEVVIRRFLAEPTTKRKVILNLGCGYDPLPFQWLSNDRELCRNALFIDIDYPALMSKKCDVISATPQLFSVIQPFEISSPSGAIYLRSPHYIALGCDLADVQALSSNIAYAIDQGSCMVLCVGEVSITYMNTPAADDLIHWAAQIEEVRFCLLEQYLPRGENYPFAQKMIQHFDNLHTPLKSIKRYPQLPDQERRFTDAGWRSAVARNLWEIWSDSTFLSAEQRLSLNAIEPFDEWEEFGLFASHYFLLEASSDSRFERSTPEHVLPASGRQEQEITRILIESENSEKFLTHRKFGTMFELGPGVVGSHGGLGDRSRLSSTTAFTYGYKSSQEQLLPPLEIESRMCHTITNLGACKSLLVGGRASPDRGMSDCWLSREHTWQRIEDLPTPLYRHSATAVARDQKEDSVLIFGGKTNGSHASDAWLLWHESTGWVRPDMTSISPGPRFGTAMSATGFNHGILFGGMASDGTIYQDFWLWEILDLQTHPRIVTKDITHFMSSGSNDLNRLCRLGASLTLSSTVFVIGGIGAQQLLPQEAEIVSLNASYLNINHPETFCYNLSATDYVLDGRHPLLIGHSVYTSNGRTIIAGGGAVCFSFGTYWNQECWTLTLVDEVEGKVWVPADEQSPPSATPNYEHVSLRAKIPKTNPTVSEEASDSVPFIKIESMRDFERISNNSKPVIIKGLDLGNCTSTWSMASLKSKVGADRLVVVHDATENHMNFQNKNFQYSTKPFGDFVDQITAGSMQYLRSLAVDKPSERPANLAMDFPELAFDFKLPPSLQTVTQNAHSSPLRISGPVTMWLHYDVMANVLCQIKGSKRLLLFPPSDVTQFQIPPGESSSPINIFESDISKYPRCQEAILGPGDVVFIPSLWLHAAAPLETTSISINVFFRDLKSGYANGRDVYGNRDIQAYEKGRRDVAKITSTFSGLPGAMRRFYLERLADELKEQALASAP